MKFELLLGEVRPIEYRYLMMPSSSSTSSNYSNWKIDSMQFETQ